MTRRLTENVPELGPAGTLLLIANGRMRWIPPGGRSGWASVIDTQWATELPSEPWHGNFPQALMEALKSAYG